jgi:hypothetical protein
MPDPKSEQYELFLRRIAMRTDPLNGVKLSKKSAWLLPEIQQAVAAALNSGEATNSSREKKAGPAVHEAKDKSEMSEHELLKQKVRERYPNAWQKWSTSEERDLNSKFAAQKSFVEIANEMGRQPSAIFGRLKKLGLIDESFEYTCTQRLRIKNEQGQFVIDPDLTQGPSAKLCDECGDIIPEARLKAMPSAKKCVKCASNTPFEKKRIQEAWGTREDYQKDRRSWTSSSRK